MSDDVTTSETTRRRHASKSAMAASARRQKIVEAVIDGKTLKDAAIAAGMSPRTASQQASMALNHPESRETFHRILEERGLTDDFLAGKLRALIDAKQTIWAQKDGVYTDSRELDALETQRKTAELVAKLRGHLKESQGGTSVEIGLMQMVVQVVKNGDEEK